MPKHVVMRRVTGRTIKRAMTREKLWNGNTEPLRNLYRWDPEQNIIRWTWTRYSSTKKKLAAAASEGAWAHATVRRLRKPAEVETFLESVERKVSG